MLLGEHEHSLDDKNRLTLPAKLREQLGDHVVITRGMDGCLYVYARVEFDQLAARIGSLDSLSADTRRMQRHFFVNATAAGLDKQGRVVIPSLLLQREGIGRDVTVTGVGDHLEIWDRATWNEQLQAGEGSAEDVAERLANRD
jgi:MraZ protein